MSAGRFEGRFIPVRKCVRSSSVWTRQQGKRNHHIIGLSFPSELTIFTSWLSFQVKQLKKCEERVESSEKAAKELKSRLAKQSESSKEKEAALNENLAVMKKEVEKYKEEVSFFLSFFAAMIHLQFPESKHKCLDWVVELCHQAWCRLLLRGRYFTAKKRHKAY